jgi:hypothetical protein
MLGSPSRSTGGVDDNDRQPDVGGHLDQPVAEPSGGHAGDRTPEPAPPLAATWPVPVVFSPVGACFGEVEIFYHDGMSAVLFSATDDAGDGRPQVPVACGRRQPGQVKIDSGGGAENVAVWSDDSDREVAMVYVDGHHRVLP